jgi:hypothetical protein
MNMKPQLTLVGLKRCASDFVRELSKHDIAELYGTTDGKAVGTNVEHRFFKTVDKRFAFKVGSSASGIDFPDLAVDLKVTSIRQPQSSCPFKSASQKVYGLGYHLLVLVYEKKDNRRNKSARLSFHHAIFIDQKHTADYQTTHGLLEILDRNGNQDDLVAYLEERNLPLDEIGRAQLAQRILSERPLLGYLTVSNALQWRLQYGRAVEIAAKGGNQGIENLLQP